MKRYIAIPILLIYMFAVCGVLINLHYCGQQLASWNVYLNTNGCGGACGDESEADHDCCSDATVSIKISEDHSVISYKLILNETPYLAGSFVNYNRQFYSKIVPQQVSLQMLPQPPPGCWQEIPLFRLFSSPTYYG